MTPLHLSREGADRVAERIRHYAQPQRLMILSCLLDGEKSVGAIDAATGVGQPALSQQLAELRHAGLLISRRAARQVYYRLADASVEARARAIETLFNDETPRKQNESPKRAPVSPKAGEPGRKTRSGAATFAQILR
jgi:DNA-binding transcriptional ArsR family regulator